MRYFNRLLILFLVLLVACESPDDTTEDVDREPSLAPSETILPVINTEPANEFLGRNNPTQAALAAEGEGTRDPAATVLATDSRVPLQVFTSDGLLMEYDYYGGQANDAPIIILLHDRDETRQTWTAFASQLQSRGYHVLVPDIRGYGTTGGSVDWERAVEDMRVLVDNLPTLGRTMISVPIGIVGVGAGGSLGLSACANTPECRTVVTISPVEDLLQTSVAVSALRDQAMLLVSADDDPDGADFASRLDSQHTGEHIWQRFGSGGAGGTLFGTQPGLTQQIINWLLLHVSLPAS